MDLRDTLKDEVEKLRTLRDELRVQIHLARLEARESWEKLEKDWEHLESRMSVVAQAGRDSADEIGESARELAREIRNGYKRLRELI